MSSSIVVPVEIDRERSQTAIEISKVAFAIYQVWCDEWRVIDPADITITRPVLIVDYEEHGELSFALSTTIIAQAGLDPNHWSWLKPVPERFPIDLIQAARIFQCDIQRYTSKESSTYLCSAVGMNDTLEARIVRSFRAAGSAQRRLFLERSLFLFLAQLEELCPDARAREEVVEVTIDGRVGGAALIARLMAEIFKMNASTNPSLLDKHLDQVFNAGRYAGCLQEILNAFEYSKLHLSEPV